MNDGLRKVISVSLLLKLILIALALGLASCNTVSGFGQDMKAAGNAISGG